MHIRDSLPEIYRSLRDGWTRKAEYVDLDDKIKFTCNISGYCCITRHLEGVPVTAPDVWTILHDERFKDTIRGDKWLFNIIFQTNVMTGNRKSLPLKLILGNHGKMPLCLTDEISETCPFLVPRKKKVFSTQLNVEIDFERLDDYGITVDWLIEKDVPTSSPDFEFFCSLGDSKPTE